MPAVTIVQASLDHIEVVLPLFDSYRQFYDQPPVEQARRFLTERLTGNESVVLLALSDGVGVGFTQLYPSFSSLSMKRLWILNDFFVAARARKQGVGEALLERAKQFALDTNAQGLILETGVDNPARKLYERLGWKQDATLHYFLNV
jgi:GNAT superfamily N-acetyltransferase